MPAVARRLVDAGAATTPEERPIDLVHLARMTLGERSLEREVLQLFDRQAATLVERMAQAEVAVAATLAHTLKGSAKGIGAWRVARASQGLEQAIGSGAPSREAAFEELAEAVHEARAYIGELLSAA